MPGDPSFIPGVYSRDRVLFAARSGDSTNIWEIGLPPETGKIAGEPRRRTSGTNTEIQPATSDSAAVFASLSLVTNIWSTADAAAPARVDQLKRITNGVSADAFPSVSADGKRMAFISERSGRANVWIRDTRTGQESQLTAGSTSESQPKISGDGTTVAYV